MPRKRATTLGLSAGAIVIVVAAIAVGISGDDGGDAGGSSAAESRSATPLPDSAPAALARNAEQGDEIVGEGSDDFEQRLAGLRGHPVVVNQWASWCTPCRVEFPFFSEMISRYSDRVAFLGLDSQDDQDAAEDFLEEVPVGFPSIFDPDASVTASIGGGQAWPTTFFYDESGEQVHIKLGAYSTQELLEEDIRRHALGEGV